MLLDIQETLQQIGEAFAEAERDELDRCNEVARQIYDRHFAARLTIGEFLCVLAFLFHKAAKELTRVTERVQ